MERKLQEKVKHIEFLYIELDDKEKEIDKLRESLKRANNLYTKQTTFAQEVHEEKCSLSLQLEIKEEEIAILKQAKCDKGCDRYNKSVDEIAQAASKHREKLIALKEISESQKEKIFCLRGHRNELFEEIDKLNSEHELNNNRSAEKLSSLQEANEILKGNLNDQKEEFEMLKSRLNQIEKSVEKNDQEEVIASLAVEMKFNDNHKKENLKIALNAIKKKTQ